MTPDVRYRWAAGDAYERYVGRWSRAVAGEFVAWLALPPDARVVDVGCGTGALGGTLLGAGAGGLLGLDRSPGYLAAARERTRNPRAHFVVADAQALPVRSDRVDAACSGLVINFVPRPAAMLAEMTRVAKPGGIVGVYVWDYAAGMEPIRRFWDAAVALDPAAAALDEGTRFPLCTPPALTALFEGAGLTGAEMRPVDVPAVFTDFDDYWQPFLSGEGPAPGYCATLPDDQREALREALRNSLPTAPNGNLPMIARAWAAKGTKPR